MKIHSEIDREVFWFWVFDPALLRRWQLQGDYVRLDLFWVIHRARTALDELQLRAGLL
jgi:hypothetical protein